MTTIRLPSLDDDYNAELFVRGQRPLFWWRKSRELAESAEIILRSHKRSEANQKKRGRYRRKIMNGVWQGIMHPISYDPADLLYAFAIENAIKGIIVGQDNDLIAEDKLAEIFSRTSHDLVRIATEGKVTVSDDELDLLRKLTQVIKWSGRYPSPNKVNDTLPVQADGKRDYAGLSYWSKDRENVRLMFKRLDALLRTMLRDKYSEDATFIPSPPKRRRRVIKYIP